MQGFPRIGCDPELFVKNPNSNSFVSGHGMVAGTKESPLKVKAGAVQVDGVALELNTNPAITENMFVTCIQTVRSGLEDLIKDSGYVLSAVPVATFDKKYFRQLPPEATAIGCDPDFNAWTGEANTPGDNRRPFRTGAGHIHVGWTDNNPDNMKSESHWNDCMTMARQLDYYVGIYTTLYDRDDRRRSMYGRAGAFRMKPYGVEYRVPSNVWLNDERLQRWIYRASTQAYRDAANGKLIENDYKDLAVAMINDGYDNWVTEWGDELHKDIGVPVPFDAFNDVKEMMANAA